jgi:hypothetical protein
MLNIKLMSKILLVYDDFAELTAIDFSLKKVGFDVIALTNEFTIKDQIIGFNPDILICSGNSNRVSTLSVGKKVKEMGRWQGKSVLIFPAQYEIPADDLLKIRMDMMLESPVPLTRLIQIIAKLTGQDDQVVIDKLVKSFSGDKSDQQSYMNQDENIRNAIQHIQGQIAKIDETKGANKLQAKASKEDLPTIFNKPAEVTKQVEDLSDTEAASKKSFEIEPEAKQSSTELSFKLKQELPEKNDGTAANQETKLNIDREKEKASSEVKTAKKEEPAKKKFSDPFQELMQELSGEKPVSESGEVQEVFDVSGDSGAPEDITEEAKAELKKQLEDHKLKMSEKLKKYSELTQNTSLYPESMMKKVKVKKQFNELKKDWDKEDLADQDDLRKEFVKAMFKKQ